uniref:CP12 domain-containing protein n=1 Tax=Kalanchoe fedtschenkoi TaxID=63787 RepID=A0A7N0US22_KALFE
MASSIACTVGFAKTGLSAAAASCEELRGDLRLRSFVSIGRRRFGSIKAALGGGGGAKYKGTQMKEQQLTEMIEKKVAEAREVCEGDATSAECKVAWDEVEEVSQAKADLRRRMEKEDPLEYFCAENPETDECRIYED